MHELSLQTSFTTFCSRSGGTHYGTSSAATLLAENINSFSLLEIQDNNSESGSAYKNLRKLKYLAERQMQVVPLIKDHYLSVIIPIMKCDVSKEK